MAYADFDWLDVNHEVDMGIRDGETCTEHKRIQKQGREAREQRKANEIPKLVNVFFVQASSITFYWPLLGIGGLGKVSNTILGDW